MPEVDSTKEQKQFYEKIPMETPGFFLKGAGCLDWGMKNRFARIFNPDSGRTVMLAIDHGYFQGPTTGLERIDLTIVPLMVHADAVMLKELRRLGGLLKHIHNQSVGAYSQATASAIAELRVYIQKLSSKP